MYGITKTVELVASRINPVRKRSRATMRRPIVRLSHNELTPTGLLSDGRRNVQNSARICNDAATPNVPAVPISAINAPANDGPTTRVEF